MLNQQTIGIDLPWQPCWLISIAPSNRQITPAEKSAFETARAALERTTAELLELEAHADLPAFVMTSARRRYEIARAEYVSCELRLRAAALVPPTMAGTSHVTVTIVGSDPQVRDSIALLLRVHRRLDVRDAKFGRWYDDPVRDLPRVVIVDVRDDELRAAHWFAGTLRTLAPRPSVIALVWPGHAHRFQDRADRVVAKPLAIRQLLAALDEIVLGDRRLPSPEPPA